MGGVLETTGFSIKLKIEKPKCTLGDWCRSVRNRTVGGLEECFRWENQFALEGLADALTLAESYDRSA